MRRVPLARRNLTADRRRAALGVGGVAVSILLVLTLQGIFEGAMRQVTSYLRSSPADVIVSQAGVRTMHMSSSALPDGLADRVRAEPGVNWVEPIWFASSAVTAGDARQLAYVIGYTPGRPGGPARLVAGRHPGPGEIVLSRLAADRLHVAVGGTVAALGSRFTVTGLSAGGTSITNTTVFTTAADFARLAGARSAYLLVGATPATSPARLRDRLARALPGTTVQTRNQFVASEARIVADMTADVMRLMTLISFAIALAVVALALYSATAARLAEYGVVKALGAGAARLTAVVAAQAAWTVAAAVIAAVAATLVVGAAVTAAEPALTVVVVPAAVARVTAGAAIAAVGGALIPLRRVLAVDPASAFRRPT
jgi:putative ABC transport system permease protein